ncbi:MAG: ATP-binding cassette domain-containing protein [Lachnospiraceae bacterium]|nr:ATP-binding cassette domain-containing protein [Lachnospiraceae bacterium]
MKLLSVSDLTYTYPGMTEPTLKDLNFDLSEGDFVVLCGQTGSGKSTFLRMLKEELRPLGEMKGSITYLKDGIVTGFVAQDPHEQVVTDKVWHELVFGMENYGYSQERMASRAAEMAEYFGIDDWYEKNVNELSGGQLQILNLASVMVTDPDILILDEPAAQLDPVSTSAFFTALRKLNRDFAVTIIIAEHRLEELIYKDDRLLVMENGMLVTDAEVSKAIRDIKMSSPLFEALPASYRLYEIMGMSGCTDRVPLAVRDGRDIVRQLINLKKSENYEKSDISQAESSEQRVSSSAGIPLAEKALEMKNVFFRYDRYSKDILTGFDLTVFKDEIFCVLGGNASGKTTAVRCAAGLALSYSGTVKVFGKKLKEYKNESLYNSCIAMLPQDVRTLFLYNTVREEVESMSGKDERERIFELLKPVCDIRALYGKHPYDLSGGEQQILGFAKVLASDPKLILADEPTKGMDAGKKRLFADILKNLKKSGITCVIVTHDAEFAALCADRCALCFKGAIVSEGEPVGFFENNGFYTTSACRMTKGILSLAVTVDGIVRQLS